MSMRTRGFRSRLLLVFATGFFALMLIGAYGVLTYRQLLTRMNSEQQHATERLLLAKEIEIHYVQQNLAWANLLLRGEDPTEYHRYLAVFYENERQTLDSAERLLEGLPSEDVLRAQTGKFVQGLHELRTQYRQALRIYNGSKQSQQATSQFLSAITEKPTEMLAEIETLLLRSHETALEDLYRAARREEMSIALVSLATLTLLLFVILWFVDTNFAKPMTHAIHTARHVAAGKVNERIHIPPGSEFGAFAEAFNLMLERLARANAEREATILKLRGEIEHREQVEQELRAQQQALETANRELEAFSYSVSHDLRAPLRAIDGFAHLLVDEYGDSLDSEGRRYVERVRKGAQRMGTLIDELLELARVSRAGLSPSAVDLSAMAHEVVAELAAADRGRKIAVNISPGLAAWGDAKLLHIVLTNLLGNAWKYTRRTFAPRIEFADVHEHNGSVFYVRDNGAGFDMQHAGQLFRPFHRLHTEREFEGNGIGLATVDRIIRRHGGKIWAEGMAGRGATFRFTLPSREEAPDLVWNTPRDRVAASPAREERRVMAAQAHGLPPTGT